MRNKKLKIIISAITSIIVITIFALAGWILLNKQFVIDQLSVWSYEESADIAAINERLALNDKGTFYFYASHPEVSPSSSFNFDCPRQEVNNPILGCYTGDGRIYIYDIQDARLDGIEEVTAAHEMLHAAWDRLSSEEQKRVGALLRAAYTSINDPALSERMDYYQRTEPGEFENELHSILGTEVSHLSSELEAYYSQYFDSRGAVVALHDQYSNIFDQLKAQADKLYSELETLNKSIQAATAQYNTDAAQLSADISRFNQRAQDGDFTSITQFNSERAALVARSNQLEQDRQAINASIDVYSNKYDQYQGIAAELEGLNSSLDSFTNLAPSPSL